MWEPRLRMRQERVAKKTRLTEILRSQGLKTKNPLPKLGLLDSRYLYDWPFKRTTVKVPEMPLEFRPDYNKIVETRLYLAHKRPGADKYLVVKLFYLADREHLIRYGRPITRDKYVALTYGPIASNAMDLMERDSYVMRKANIDTLPFDIGEKQTKRGATQTLGRPHREIDRDLFSRTELAVLDETIAAYGGLDFDGLYNLTHSHFAYNRAWNSRSHGSHAADMRYDEMIEDDSARQRILEDIGPIAKFIR